MAALTQFCWYKILEPFLQTLPANVLITTEINNNEAASVLQGTIRKFTNASLDNHCFSKRTVNRIRRSIIAVCDKINFDNRLFVNPIFFCHQKKIQVQIFMKTSGVDPTTITINF